MTVEFGLALENFTPERKVPEIDAVSAYSVRPRISASRRSGPGTTCSSGPGARSRSSRR